MQTFLSSRKGLYSANYTPSTPNLAFAFTSPLTPTGPNPILAPINATSTTTTAAGIDSLAPGLGDSELAPIDVYTFEFDKNLLSVLVTPSVPGNSTPSLLPSRLFTYKCPQSRFDKPDLKLFPIFYGHLQQDLAIRQAFLPLSYTTTVMDDHEENRDFSPARVS